MAATYQCPAPCQMGRKTSGAGAFRRRHSQRDLLSGVLRALADNELLKRFDVLSTVSGGGYGSMLGRLFMQPKVWVPW